MILKNLYRHKGRTLLTLLGIIIGGFAILLLNARVNGLEGDYNSLITGNKWQTLKTPIPTASCGVLRDFAPSGTGLLIYSFRAPPGETYGSSHSSHQQAGGYSGIRNKADLVASPPGPAAGIFNINSIGCQRDDHSNDHLANVCKSHIRRHHRGIDWRPLPRITRTPAGSSRGIAL